MDGKEALLDVAVEISDEAKSTPLTSANANTTYQSFNADNSNSKVLVKLSAETITKFGILAALVNECRTNLYFACDNKKSPLPIFARVLGSFCELTKEVASDSSSSSSVYPIISIDPVNSIGSDTSTNSSADVNIHEKLERLQLEMNKWRVTSDNYKSEYCTKLHNTPNGAMARVENYQMLVVLETMQTEIDTAFTALKKLLATVPKDFATLRAEAEQRGNADCKLFLMLTIIIVIAAVIMLSIIL